mmetsp:Transcript_15617/g.27681  ORF Transcript_15617/g.27681 Transcript_15617/m.27681 type:complete len:219 (-) Transcript_15617:343-999(-)
MPLVGPVLGTSGLGDALCLCNGDALAGLPVWQLDALFLLDRDHSVHQSVAVSARVAPHLPVAVEEEESWDLGHVELLHQGRGLGARVASQAGPAAGTGRVLRERQHRRIDVHAARAVLQETHIQDCKLFITWNIDVRTKLVGLGHSAQLEKLLECCAVLNLGYVLIGVRAACRLARVVQHPLPDRLPGLGACADVLPNQLIAHVVLEGREARHAKLPR